MLSLRRCDYESSTFAKPDTSGSVAVQIGPHDNLVAVVQELSFFTRRERDRLGAPARELEHASLRARLRTGNGTACEQVTCLRVATVAGVMRQHLRRRPVHVCE